MLDLWRLLSSLEPPHLVKNFLNLMRNTDGIGEEFLAATEIFLKVRFSRPTLPLHLRCTGDNTVRVKFKIYAHCCGNFVGSRRFSCHMPM